MRVAGTVIWSTDLREEKSTSGGGKGRPKTTSYSYSASLAVALSGRPIGEVRRIWADGKLLRGAGGDFKSRTQYRLYRGGEDHAADPLIASAEGIGQTPAYRGIAYAMFEDFELADYGNRIPSLTFEVVAEDAPVTVGSIAEELSEGALIAGSTPLLTGFAAGGDSVRGVLEALADVAPLSLVEEDGRLRIETGPGEPVLLEEADLCAPPEIVRRAAASVAGEVSVAYHDDARDYQTGLQRASNGGTALRSNRRALPAVLSAEGAKAIAEYRLASLWAGRETAKVRLGQRRSRIRPGSHARLPRQPGLWKVERWTLTHMAASLDLVRVPARGIGMEADADPGRPVGQPDLPHGPTTVHLFDLPLYDEPLVRPRLHAMAGGAESGWRRAELTISYDDGASWAAAGSTASGAVMGETVSALTAGGSALFDERGSVEVELLNDAMWLEGRNDAALVGGANLAAIGDELIQFGAAQALGGRRFRLSRLLRGRRGTEWAAEAHEAGETFVLIEPETLSVIEPPPALLGGEARLLAAGLGDGVEGVSVSRNISGETIRPPSPVHVRGERLPNGDINIAWVRRSRSGWSWLDGGDAPLAEESEAYRLTLSGEGFERTITPGEPFYLYTAAEQAADGLAGTLSIQVCQLGTVTASRSRHIHLLPGE
jgi:hypothetical protein